jgi:uncharacterized protein (TIGR02996 family)
VARKRVQAARPELIALIDACKDAPDDDAPCLVLADWLDEHGDEHDRARAEFVRSQVSRVKLDDEDPRWLEHYDREGELLRQHGEAWMGSLGDVVQPNDWNFVHNHHRGLFSLHSPADVSLASEKQLARSEAWAWVYSLTVTSSPATSALDALARSPLLASLTGLGIDWPGLMEEAGLDSLLASRRLKRLRSLSLRGCKFAHAAHAVAAARRLKNLTKLDLEGNPIGDQGAQRLASALHLRGLRELSLGNCDVGRDGAGALGGSPMLGRIETLHLTSNKELDGVAVAYLLRAGMPCALKKLDLGGTAAGDGGAAAIASAPQLAGLRELALNFCGIGDEGATALAESPHLRHLERLLLPSNDVGPAGIVALARSPILATVTDLTLGANRLDAASMRALASAPLTSLRELSVRENSIGPDGARALTKSAALANLEWLDVVSCGIGDSGLEALARSPHLSRLTYLDASDNGLRDRGVIALAKSKSITRLRTLWLQRNEIGEDGIVALAASPGMSELRVLSLEENSVGNDGAKAIADSPHLTQLRELEMNDNDVGDVGALALATSPYLQHLTDLGLMDNFFSAESAKAIYKRFTMYVAACDYEPVEED